MGWKNAAVVSVLAMAGLFVWWATGFEDMRRTLDPTQDDAVQDGNEGADGAGLEGRASEKTVEGEESDVSPSLALRVRVVDGQGRPQSGVAVHLEEIPSTVLFGLGPEEAIRRLAAVGRSAASVRRGSAVTDDQGQATLAGIPERGHMRVHVRAPAPHADVLREVPTDRDRLKEPLEIVLGQGVDLAIQVVGAEGPVTISGWARPNIFDRQQGVPVAAVTTDASGRAQLRGVEGGSLAASFRMPSKGLTWRREIPLPHAGVWQVQAPNAVGTIVEGVVVDDAGRPVSGAQVVATTSASTGRLHAVRSARTDAEGRYRMEDVHGNVLTQVRVSAAGHVLRSLSDRRALVPGVSNILDVILPGARALRGRVVDEEGAPIEGVSVRWWADSRASRHRQEFMALGARTDAQGRFLLQGVPDLPLSLVLESTGWAPTSLESLRGHVPSEWDDEERRFVMRPGGQVHGVVVDEEGAVVPHAKVAVGGESSTSWEDFHLLVQPVRADAEGRFRFDRLHVRGRVFLRAHAGAMASGLIEATASADDAAPPVEIPLRRGPVIHGTVRGVRGQPLEGIQIEVAMEDGQDARVRSDAEGVWRLDRLRPPATLPAKAWAGEIHIDPPSGWPAWRHGRDARRPHPVVVESAQDHVQVDVTLPVAGAIRGVLVDADGHPVANHMLTIQPVDESRRERQHLVSQAAGAIQMLHLPPGRYVVLDGERELGVVRPGDHDLQWTVQPQDLASPSVAEICTLLVRMPDGRRVPRARLQVLPVAGPSRSPTYLRLQDGVATLALRGPRATWTQARVLVREIRGLHGERLPAGAFDGVVDMAPGGTTSITLPEAREVRGRVRDEQGMPVSGVRVSLRWSPPPHGRRGDLQVRTDREGRFAFPGLPVGKGEVVLGVHGRFLPVPAAPVDGSEGELELRVQQGATLEGRVLDPSGTPTTAANVQFHASNALGVGGRPLIVGAAPDAEGGFVLRGLPRNARGRLTASPRTETGTEGWSTVSLMDVVAGSRGHVLQLTHAVHIQGRLVFTGSGDVPRAVKGHAFGDGSTAGVYLRFEVAADGTFRVGPMAPGPYKLSFELPPPWARLPPRVVEAPAQGVQVDVTEGVMLEGRLEGVITPGLVVQWSPLDAVPFAPLAQARVRPDGGFSIKLHRDMPGRLYAFDETTGATAWVVEIRVQARPVVVHLGRGLDLSGTVEAPKARTPVIVNAKGHVLRTTVVQPDGSWAIRGLPPGTYAVEARRDLRVVHHDPVPAGTRDIHLELR